MSSIHNIMYLFIIGYNILCLLQSGVGLSFVPRLQEAYSLKQLNALDAFTYTDWFAYALMGPS